MKPKVFKLNIILTVLVGVGLVFISCQSLDTASLNEPDTERALGTPEDVEALIKGSMLAWFRAHNRWGVEHMGVMADALTWSWGNFGGQDMSSEPRIAYPNNTSYVYQSHLDLPWQRMFSALSAASDGLRQIRTGGLIIENETRTHRAEAFAKLVQGLATGYIACFYDRAFILDETVNIDEVGPAITLDQYSPYQEVMATAIAQLEEAIELLETGPAIETEEDWVNGVIMTNEDLAKVAHSYTARYLAQVARSPEERAAVDWNKVKSHAERGVTEAFAPQGDGTFGDWWHSQQWFHNDRGASWGRLDYKMIGGADESDGYQNWLNTPVQQRTEFDMVTGDQRLSGITIKNHADEDVDGGIYAGNWGASPFRANRGTYHFSKYGYYRYENFGLSGNQGPMPIFLPEENDFLIAEALLRMGDAAGAAALIDKTRVTNGGYSPAMEASGGNIGNPDDPRSPLNGSSLWAMLKYEKHLECLMTGAGLEYFDNRGWGDLVTDTPLHAPVPAEELEVLRESVYTFGGGGPGSAPKLSAGPPPRVPD
ncbi:hypothetical protein GWO43_26190 [candidate division KSB1 bacterium]|nr:hypothetical protein [candidate division KSB1 bacterium]NIR70776.1 hypothetical protein [candidate division KSB1 bacterium]NIT74301.1 hypothetical protein [candidate division KSB1 bacterium]NIV69275.1 hypothetical protein [Phycisphaerae bacterium]NIX73981.1 hypothetical protein [candidate division KSB1 bacterium]